jgi:uncharacterized protein with LGFP repeats
MHDLPNDGQWASFQGGAVYYSKATGAHEIHGPIKSLWSSLGAYDSWLGYPTSDAQTGPGYYRSDFVNGYIIFDGTTATTHKR